MGTLNSIVKMFTGFFFGFGQRFLFVINEEWTCDDSEFVLKLIFLELCLGLYAPPSSLNIPGPQ
jgi:hypothetical protein